MSLFKKILLTLLGLIVAGISTYALVTQQHQAPSPQPEKSNQVQTQIQQLQQQLQQLTPHQHTQATIATQHPSTLANFTFVIRNSQALLTANAKHADRWLQLAQKILQQLSKPNQQLLQPHLEQLIDEVHTYQKKPPITPKKILTGLHQQIQAYQLSANPESPIDSTQPASAPSSDHNHITGLSYWHQQVKIYWSNLLTSIYHSVKIEHNPTHSFRSLTASDLNRFKLYIQTLISQAQWALYQHNHELYHYNVNEISAQIKTHIPEKTRSTQLNSLLQQLAQYQPSALPDYLPIFNQIIQIKQSELIPTTPTAEIDPLPVRSKPSPLAPSNSSSPTQQHQA